MADPLTAEEIAELRRLEREATPGPWETSPPTYDAVALVKHARITGPEFFDDSGDDHNDVAEVTHHGNARLLAAARNALPRLLDEVEQRRKAADEVVASIKAARLEGPPLDPLISDWLGSLCAIMTKP